VKKEEEERTEKEMEKELQAIFASSGLNEVLELSSEN